MIARTAALRGRMRIRSAIVVAAMVGAFLLLPVVSAGAAEGDPDGDRITVQVTIAPVITPPGDREPLPATGGDPGLLPGVALTLVALGIVLVARRRIRSEEEDPSSRAR